MQKTPNYTAVLILGITSFIGCFCYGIVGVILSIIGIVLANKDLKLIADNPDVYSKDVKTWKIICIIALVLSVLSLIITIISIAFVGFGSFNDPTEMQKIFEGMK
ncbi:MAG: CCC motif membrane protein [Flavobacterium sp.]